MELVHAGSWTGEQLVCANDLHGLQVPKSGVSSIGSREEVYAMHLQPVCYARSIGLGCQVRLEKGQ